MSNSLIAILPWDSSHFGFAIARARPRHLDLLTFRQLESACIDQGIDCLYFLADAADQATISILQQGRFDMVDIRLTLAGPVCNLISDRPAEEFLYRFGHKGDLEGLLPIAGDSYQMSRFYTDQRFDRGKTSEMYRAWLINSLTAAYADAVVVAELAGQPVGYVTCHLQNAAGEANLGLVGVAASARGMGCMKGMLHFLGHWLISREISRANVVTQGKNIPAQRAYQRNGFRTRSVELWFHKWFQKQAE